MSNKETEDPDKMFIVQKWRRLNFDFDLILHFLMDLFQFHFLSPNDLRAILSIIRPMSMESLETFYWKSGLAINQPTMPFRLMPIEHLKAARQMYLI